MSGDASSRIEVDVAIIGAGTAGLTARRGALQHEKSVLMIESGPYGTTCARVGCMPSKLLIAAADAAEATRQADAFGVKTTLEVDGRRVLARVRAERDRFVRGVLDSVERIPDDQKLRGHARFLSDTVLDVDGVRVEAKAVVIATGSSTWVPAQVRNAGERVLTSDTIFDLETLPESVAVFGSGVIGIELGQALHRLGVRTVLLDPGPGLNFLTDPDVRASAFEVLGRELALYTNARIEDVEPVEGGVRVRWVDENGGPHEETFERVLAAAGRRPNVAGLGLENTSIVLDDKGLPRFDPRTMQIGELPIFIAGDVTNERPLLHEAADEGRIAGGNAATFPNVRATIRRAGLTIVFSDPQMAVVGESWQALEHTGVGVGQVDFGRQGRARVMGKNAGLMRVYGSRECGLLEGAEMIAPGGEHMAHLLAWAVQERLSVNRLLGMPVYHPVLEEGMRTALQSLAKALKVNDLPCSGDSLRNGPGV